ncbi:MAG: site-specific DNA-methyltransferase, partial [Bdellovibrionales bacterium]|nr:site-specific DNA-methyltransferase [Bdellovibrionales bacterium]
FIEGDNLEVLKLLQHSYYNKVKMIYIDPPYNTGKDFIYPDKYSETLDTYLQYTDQKNTEGKKFSTNQETDGRFHSKWINMMYPRLFLARNLLREDGVIFISIDDNEISNLRKICDEIFGEENFINCFIWNSTKSVTNTAIVSVSHTYKLVYAKKIEFFTENRFAFRFPEDGEGFSNPDNDPRGAWKADPFQVGGWRPNQQYKIKNPKTGQIYKPNAECSWKNDHETFLKLLKDNRIIFGSSGEASPKRKRFLFEAKERGKVSKTWWDDVGTTTNGTETIKELFNDKNIFSNPKSVDLIKRMIQLGDYTKNGIILDFFAGSGTTAHAVYEKNLEDGGNRKYICVQLPEPTQENTEAYKAGYKNIADIGKERIRRAIKKIKEENKQQSLLDQNKNNLDLGFKVFKLDKSNFKIWKEEVSKDKTASEQVEMHLEDSINPNSSEEDLLYEILIKTGYELTTLVKSLKLADKKVYSVENNALLICLDRKITKNLIIEMARLKPARIVCLDIGFDNNDHLKTDAMETFKSYGVIDFKTI